MNIKLGCAMAVLSFMCVSYVNGGALKKDFLKSGEQKEEKNDDHIDANESEEEEEEAALENAVEQGVASESATPAGTGASSSDSGEKKKITGDPVVLRIGRKEIRRSKILEAMKMLPPQLVKGLEPKKLFAMMVEQEMSTYLMVENAKKAGMDKNKEFLEKIERTKDELLARIFLMKEVAPKVENESNLKARYTKYLVEFKKGKEHLTFHIMLKTKEEADKVLAELAKGKDFSKIAKEKSLAPSKEKGGEEGFIPLDILPPAIKDKLIALKSGEYTKDPIKTEAGFHIFKIGESRDAVPQKFEEVKDMLKQMIMQEEIMKMIQRLKKQYNVEKFNEDGTPMPSELSNIADDGQSAAVAAS